MQESAEIAARVGADSLLAIDNPDGSLPASAAEVGSAAAVFARVTRLQGAQATRAAVLQGWQAHAVLHFSTHGTAGWNDPLHNSKLRLADGDLTLAELLEARLPGARLAVLSACETGIPGTQLPDEIVNLPSGLLQAGFGGVAASLWSVEDASTAMLMARFYELWRAEGIAPPQALRQAQIWLRDSSDGEKQTYFKAALPHLSRLRLSAESAEVLYGRIALNEPHDHSFEHPFYWAGFTYTGV